MGRRRIHSTHLPANHLKSEHYYYLGLHYQATEQPKKAEMMLRKAIQINDTVVGLESFQVIFKYKMYTFLAESVFSLRSMRKWRSTARQSRSPSDQSESRKSYCSDLELDYKGLMHIYKLTGDHEKFLEYQEGRKKGRI